MFKPSRNTINNENKMFREFLIVIAVHLLVVLVNGNSSVVQEIETTPEVTTEASTEEVNETETSTAASEESLNRPKPLNYLTPHADIKDSDNNNDNYESVKHIIKKSAAAVIKCSRRFTPGACMEPVYSVWTYVFDKQNCTERLGCRKSENNNRFKSYNRCLHRCEPLREIYTEILSMEDGYRKLPLVLRNRWSNNKQRNVPRPTTEAPDFESDNAMRPIAREEIDYGIEREVLNEGEWGEDLDEQLRVPYDVDSFSADSAVLEHFYYDRD